MTHRLTLLALVAACALVTTAQAQVRGDAPAKPSAAAAAADAPAKAPRAATPVERADASGAKVAAERGGAAKGVAPAAMRSLPADAKPNKASCHHGSPSDA